jgi:ABC-type cobalamin/Fe3+-siderophores transport system ATPase subunit
MSAGVRARDVRVELGGRLILDGVDLDAAPGALTAIVGPNGSGKTTLLRALAGLVPSTGEIRVGGVALPSLTPEQRAQRVAYLPQASQLEAMLSASEVVALGRYAARLGPFGRPRDDGEAVARALGRVGIGELAQRPYPWLSGGQKRLVLLARALVTGASTLLLDEPTASLDVKNALELFALLASLARDGYTLVVVLHDLDDVQRHAAHALLLDGGRARAAGSPRASAFVEAAEATYGVTLVPAERLGFRLPAAGQANATEQATQPGADHGGEREP